MRGNKHASCQFALGERLASRERRQQHKLIGRHSKLRKSRFRAAMKGHISGPQLKRQLIFRLHQACSTGPSIRVYTHEVTRRNKAEQDLTQLCKTGSR